MENTLQLIISFLGGGILVAFINWARTSRSERTTRKNEFLKEQITRVYGPLYFYVCLNESLFELNAKFHKAYKEHFSDQKWSKDPYSMENLRKEMGITLELANYYVGIVRDNNNKIVDLLRDNYSYIDPEDTEVFQQFIIDHLRMEKEFKKEEPLATPFEIYEKVGDISFSRNEFLELVKKKFTEKNKVIKSFQ
jgi:hypothetical protein